MKNPYTKLVFIMPRIETRYINRAKKSELKVLYYLFGNEGDFDIAACAAALEETPEAVSAALSFWRGAGVIEEIRADTASAQTDRPSEDLPSEKEKEKSRTQDTVQKTAPSSSYTLSEITAARDRNTEFASLVTYLEKLTGHLYNAAEQGIVLYLYDTLGINYEVIMGVAQYCVSKGKSSVRYIQKTTMNIADEGVTTYAELEAYFGAQKSKDEYRNMVRRIIGAERALSKNECVHVDAWERCGHSEELVAYAYEKTVAKINKPQIAYMAKILESWKDKDLMTPAAVDEFFSTSANRHDKSSDGRLEFDLEAIFEKPTPGGSL